MTERPILFSAPMVRAILAGNKTQTRRVIKPQPEFHEMRGFLWKGSMWGVAIGGGPYMESILRNCPYGVPGDRLWVREAFGICCACASVVYRADENPNAPFCQSCDAGISRPYRPSIHMPRHLSRITLEVTDVRVQRIQDISEEDARAEGCTTVDAVQWYSGLKPMVDGTRVRQDTRGTPPDTWTNIELCGMYDPLAHTAVQEFTSLWDSINAKRGFGWAANPWVWAISFRRTA